LSQYHVSGVPFSGIEVGMEGFSGGEEGGDGAFVARFGG